MIVASRSAALRLSRRIGLFSGIETGIIAINRWLDATRRATARRRRESSKLLRQTDRLLAQLCRVVGNNLVNVMLATVAAAIGEAQGGAVGQMVSGVLIALAVLICGEYLPKAWFTSRPLERCLPFAHLLQLAEQLLKPLASFCMFLTQWATVGAGTGRRTQFVDTRTSAPVDTDSEPAGRSRIRAADDQRGSTCRSDCARYHDPVAKVRAWMNRRPSRMLSACVRTGDT